ncbi:unnamed protein product, partial [Polarella glacialis]
VTGLVADDFVIAWVADMLNLSAVPEELHEMQRWQPAESGNSANLVLGRPSPLRYPHLLAPWCSGRTASQVLPEIGAVQPEWVDVGKWGPPGGLPIFVWTVIPRQLLQRIAAGGIELSLWILDLGAADMDTMPLAELVLLDGSAAILVEGDVRETGSADYLRQTFRDRPDVCIVSELLSPEDLPQALLNCTESWVSWRRSDGSPLASTESGPDWLKIDVDNGGCDFLASAILHGLQPLVVQLELREYPAPLFFWQRFQQNATCPYKTSCTAFCKLSQDCSLAAAAAILGPEYVAFPQLQGHDMVFIRRDAAQILFPGHSPVDLEAFSRDLWCSMTHQATHLGTLERLLQFDPRLWLDPASPVEERQALLREYAEHNFP